MFESISREVIYLELFAKLKKYKERVLEHNKTIESASRLYIEPQTGLFQEEDRNGIQELDFEIKKNFLNFSRSTASKVLLLTGQAEVGKTFILQDSPKSSFIWLERTLKQRTV